jgi:DNA-binding transcriptional ArsR family regulator
MRLRVLALAGAEELSVGELGELLDESQPNVSRHVAALRRAGLLAGRREGTRLFVRLARPSADDAVVADALQTGRRLCQSDGSLARVPSVVRARDQRTRAFFSRSTATLDAARLPDELLGYLFAMAEAFESRQLAVDAGTGNGAWLDVLAPIFHRVVALDRSEAQLKQARKRVEARGYGNVTLVCSEIEGPQAVRMTRPGADLVTCSRVLHHSALPGETLRALASLARPGGLLLVVDYLPHQDEVLENQQADVWLGFDPNELLGFARSAGLVNASTRRIPAGWLGTGPDHHLAWQVLSGRCPTDRDRARASA